MDDSNQAYCLRWNNHRSNLLTVFDNLLQNESFTDVTLALEDGQIIKCHRIVLAACSTYFQNILLNLPNLHPVIVLKDVKYADMKAILEYIYRGEVKVSQAELTSLLKVAESLQVKGLIEHTEEQSSALDFRCRGQDDVMETSVSPPPSISTSTIISNATAHSSEHTSPPHSTGGVYDYHSKSLSATQLRTRLVEQLSTWTLSSPQHFKRDFFPARLQHSSCSDLRGNGISYDNPLIDHSMSKLDNPCPRRIKNSLQSNLTNRDTPILRTVLGQGHVDSSVQDLQPLLHPDSHESTHFRASSSNGSTHDNDHRHGNLEHIHEESAHSSYVDTPSVDEDIKPLSPQSHAGDSKSGIGCRRSPTGNAGCVQAKPEWKRYKQYTRDDIASAIDAVRKGMSAVQAARRFSVPSRTLYDKVKKLGIPTSRPSKRSSISNGSAACFPYGIGGNVNGSIYNSNSNLISSENEIDTSNNVIETTSSSTSNASVFDTLHAKLAKEVSQDRDSMIETMASCSLSPVMHCSKLKQQHSDDEVEDLSVSRKSDIPVIVQHLTSSDIKDEPKETTDNKDCSYN
ncbi:uncharacterized protein LOC114945094 [Nylanderia fulva]|uniref:uncharacterized protein LOC114945094 n=1 Tax=Nylanderia fulva TaxID=613905 RepID=UPI0010FB50F7|nr:uncharacterized protein LOC114945094 [Nylanderia fulva]